MIPNKEADCIVIGAGICGLTAASHLQANGLPVRVIDKGRGVGGRMATRRFAGGIFDHGAQFFTTRDTRFVETVQNWQADRLVNGWSFGFSRDGSQPPAVGNPRYIAAKGMTAIPKFLASKLPVAVGKKATSLSRSENQWKVVFENGETQTARSVLLTAPVPQCLELLAAGKTPLDPESRRTLEAVHYDPCLCLLMICSQTPNLPDPGAVQLLGEPISWIADNYRKGISAQPGSVTLHAGPEFSRAYWQAPQEEVARVLIDAAAEWVGDQIQQYQLKRWRYAQPVATYPKPYLWLSKEPPLIIAGDAFGGPRVEGAYLSGLEAARQLGLIQPQA